MTVGGGAESDILRPLAAGRAARDEEELGAMSAARLRREIG